MSKLAAKECVPCRGGVPPMSGDQAQSILRELGTGWRVVDDHHLSKEYAFADFAQALAFVNRVGAMAETQRHHPDIYLTWGKARVEIWTHKIDGLTESDFVFAAKTDQCL